MSPLNILWVLWLSSSGICGQQIELKIPPSSASCKKGFRANMDSYCITGTIGPRFNELKRSGWIPWLALQVLPVGAKDFTLLCEAIFEKFEVGCQEKSEILCHCNQYDTKTTTGHILIRYPALASNNLGTIRGRLVNANGSIIDSTINKTLPEIYDVRNAVLTLTVNGVQADTKTESCGLSFMVNKMNTIKLCCSDAAMPCYPRLDFDGTIVSRGVSPCAEYIVRYTTSKTVNVTKWYTVCILNDYRSSGFCMIQTGGDVQARTHSETPEKDSSTGLVLGLVLGLGIPIISGIILGIYCWTKHKENPARTNENAGDIGDEVKQETPQ